jgi:hypothetical protein
MILSAICVLLSLTGHEPINAGQRALLSAATRWRADAVVPLTSGANVARANKPVKEPSSVLAPPNGCKNESTPTVVDGVDVHNTGRMFVALALGALVLYIVIRLAVRHGIEDAHRRQRAASSLTDGDGSNPSSPVSGSFRASLRWFFGAFGWFG